MLAKIKSSAVLGVDALPITVVVDINIRKRTNTRKSISREKGGNQL